MERPALFESREGILEPIEPLRWHQIADPHFSHDFFTAIAETRELGVIVLHYDTRRIEGVVTEWCVAIKLVQLVRCLPSLLGCEFTFGDAGAWRKRAGVRILHLPTRAAIRRIQRSSPSL